MATPQDMSSRRASLSVRPSCRSTRLDETGRCLLVLLGFGFMAAPLAIAQETPRLLRRLGNDGASELYRVSAAAARGGEIAVLTRSEPAVHLFSTAYTVSFGGQGQGRMELEAPVDITWLEEAVLVLDLQQQKIVSFRTDGMPTHSRPLKGHWANRLYVSGSDTIVGTFMPMTGRHAVLRLRGATVDTLLAYDRGAPAHKLQAPGAPSLSVYEPFSATAQWTVTVDGTLATWTPGEGSLRILDTRGNEIERIDLGGSRWRVTSEDEEAWFTEEFVTAEFMGRQVFRPLLERAREVVSFPDAFPAALNLRGHPFGGVWTQRTSSARGETWELLAEKGGGLGVLQLPPGRELLRVSPVGLIARWVDDLGIEYIEVYALPVWAVKERGST